MRIHTCSIQQLIHSVLVSLIEIMFSVLRILVVTDQGKHVICLLGNGLFHSA